MVLCFCTISPMLYRVLTLNHVTMIQTASLTYINDKLHASGSVLKVFYLIRTMIADITLSTDWNIIDIGHLVVLSTGYMHFF